MTEQTTEEQLAELDPIPTLEDVVPQYGDDQEYYRCDVCGSQTHAPADHDVPAKHLQPTGECDGEYVKVSRASFLEHDDQAQTLLVDAQRAWREARGLEQPE